MPQGADAPFPGRRLPVVRPAGDLSGRRKAAEVCRRFFVLVPARRKSIPPLRAVGLAAWLPQSPRSCAGHGEYCRQGRSLPPVPVFPYPPQSCRLDLSGINRGRTGENRQKSRKKLSGMPRRFSRDIRIVHKGPRKVHRQSPAKVVY